jgi:MprA protease rhombosortase-interaction domain-containing protein
MYGRYRGNGLGTISLRADVEGRDLKQIIEVSFPKKDSLNPEIERMWALQRVIEIGNEVRASGRSTPSQASINEVVRLGEGYSIVTPYTSFLVLENDGEYARWKIERKNALRLSRDRSAQESLRAELNEIRSQASANLGPLAAQKMAKAEPVRSDRSVGNRSQVPTQTRLNSAHDVNMTPQGDGKKGGGAFDPISGSLVLGLGIAAFRRRRRSKLAD